MTYDAIEETVQRLTDSSGGQILLALKDGLQRSLPVYLGFFVLGFVSAFPASSRLIAWLIDADRLPSDVDIIVVSPVEFLFLQLRIAGSFGLMLVVMFMVTQVARHGARHQAVQTRLQELDVRLPRPGPTVILAVVAASTLMLMGLLYAWYALIPMLLDYLPTMPNKRVSQPNGGFQATQDSSSICSRPQPLDFKRPLSPQWCFVRALSAEDNSLNLDEGFGLVPLFLVL